MTGLLTPEIFRASAGRGHIVDHYRLVADVLHSELAFKRSIAQEHIPEIPDCTVEFHAPAELLLCGQSLHQTDGQYDGNDDV